MSTQTQKRPRRLGLIIPWAIFAIIVIAWTVYWFVLANAAQSRFNAAVAAERANGAEVQIGETRTGGFPLQFALTLTDVSYAPSDRSFRASTPRLVVHVNVLNPYHLIVAFSAPVDIARSDTTSRLTATKALASIRFSGASLARASLETEGLRIDDLNKPGDGVLIAKAVAHVRPDERTAGSYQLALQMEQIALPEPVRAFETFGQTIEALNAAVVLDHAEAFAGAPRGDLLGPWSAADGQARVEALNLAWGALHTQGQGALSLDEARRPQGSLTLKLSEPATTLRALANSPSLSNDAKRAMQVAAVAYTLSGDTIDIPLQADDGFLKLATIPLRPLPPLYKH
jgi:hypothetical protein